MLAAVNGFCRFMAWHIKVKFLKIQRQIFRDSAKELTKEEYDRLLTAARGKWAGTASPDHGNSLRHGHPRVRAAVYHRGGRPAGSDRDLPQGKKVRTILLPGKLCRKLLKYARKHKTVSGEIFLTRNGTISEPPPDLDRA